jgi:hypothetical protein
MLPTPTVDGIAFLHAAGTSPWLVSVYAPGAPGSGGGPISTTGVAEPGPPIGPAWVSAPSTVRK